MQGDDWEIFVIHISDKDLYQDTDSIIKLPGARGKEKWGVWFNTCEISAQDDEKILEMDSGECCTTLWMHLMTEFYT